MDTWNAYRSRRNVRETHRGAYLLALGHPGDRPLAPIEHPSRRLFDDVVHFGQW